MTTAQQRNPRYAVPVNQCRPGTVIECHRPTIGVIVGVIESVDATAGYREYRVRLRDATIDGEPKPPHMKAIHDKVYGGITTVHLQFAARILKHGTGAVAYEPHLAVNRPTMQEHLAFMRSAAVRRQGAWLVMSSAQDMVHSAVNHHVARMLRVYLATNMVSLGISPTEMIDSRSLHMQMWKQGIIKYSFEEGSNDLSLARVNTVRMKRFIRQNINRFRRSLNQAIRSRDEELAAMSASYRTA